ncbi:MAG: histidine--tRNA ligase, partial [Treponema sp.]|nr:histidine--tRNA ligase [Treponema sp.]
AGLSELGLTNAKGSYLDAEIFNTDESLAIHYQKVAGLLRKSNVAVEVFPDCVKMNRQYNVTEKKGMKWGILITPEQAAQDKLTLKNLKTREQFADITVEEAVKLMKAD